MRQTNSPSAFGGTHQDRLEHATFQHWLDTLTPTAARVTTLSSVPALPATAHPSAIQAADAFEARGKVKSLRPDVLTLDVSMPGMSGIQFLSNLMRLQPMPVVMCSATTEAGADVTLEALAIGAVDFVTKPGTGSRTLTEYRDTVVAKLRAAAYAQVRRPTVTGATGAPLRTTPGSQSVPAHPAAARLGRAVDVIAIGASTGGVAAIESLLDLLPRLAGVFEQFFKLTRVRLCERGLPFVAKLLHDLPRAVQAVREGVHAFVIPARP